MHNMADPLGQSLSLVSDPMHSTWPRWIGPTPGVTDEAGRAPITTNDQLARL